MEKNKAIFRPPKPYDNLIWSMVLDELNILDKSNLAKTHPYFKEKYESSYCSGDDEIISAGGSHILFLRKNDIFAWGGNAYGQCDIPQKYQGKFIAVSAGYHHSIGLTIDGKVICWGRNDRCIVPDKHQGNFIAISAGNCHSMALTINGKVVCWGSERNDRCQVPIEHQGNFKAISAGGSHSMALTNNNIVVCWGANDYHQCEILEQFQGEYLAISAGGGQSYALLKDRIIAVGYKINKFNSRILSQYTMISECKDTMISGQYISISGGQGSFVALKEDKSIYFDDITASEDNKVKLPQEIKNNMILAISVGTSYLGMITQNNKIIIYDLIHKKCQYFHD